MIKILSVGGAVGGAQVLVGFALHHARVGRDVVGQPHVAPDDGVVSDADATQHRGVGIDGHVVLDDGVAGRVLWVAFLVVGEVACAQCHTLVEHHMVADNGGLTDDDAGAVVYGEMGADLRGGVYVDAGVGVCQFGDDAWQHGDAQLVQRVCGAVVGHHQYGGVAEHRLGVARCCGVILRHRFHVGQQCLLDGGQLLDKLQGTGIGLLLYRIGTDIVGKSHAAGRLLPQDGVDAAGVHADVFAEEMGKEDPLDVPHQLAQLVDGGQFVVFAQRHDGFLCRHLAQCLDSVVKYFAV